MPVVETADDTTLLRAQLTVRPPTAADCPVVDSCADGRDVTQRIKAPDEAREQAECHTDMTCDDENTPDRMYRRSAVQPACPCPVFETHDCIPDLRGLRDGALVFVISVPSRGELRELVGGLREIGAEVSVEYLVTGRDDQPVAEIDVSAITDKQRRALEVAREVGYYETPREAALEDVADRLGVSPSAVSQRLNAAETTLVRSLLDGGH